MADNLVVGVTLVVTYVAGDPVLLRTQLKEMHGTISRVSRVLTGRVIPWFPDTVAITANGVTIDDVGGLNAHALVPFTARDQVRNLVRTRIFPLGGVPGSCGFVYMQTDDGRGGARYHVAELVVRADEPVVVNGDATREAIHAIAEGMINAMVNFETVASPRDFNVIQPASTSGTSTAGASTSGSPPDPVTHFYPPQQLIGDGLGTKMRNALGDGVHFIHVFLTIPNFTSLEEQTRQRLEDYLTDAVNNNGWVTVPATVAEGVTRAIVRISPGAANQARIDTLKRVVAEVRATNDQAVLLIQDECHWGINDGSGLSSIFNGADFVAAQVEGKLLVLQVSATPENVLFHETDFANRVVNIASSDVRPEEYTGVFEFLVGGNGTWRCDPDLGPLVFRFAEAAARPIFEVGFGKGSVSAVWKVTRDMVVLLSYVAELRKIAFPGAAPTTCWESPVTADILATIFDVGSRTIKRKLIVIRVASIATALFFQRILREVRDLCGLEVNVVSSTGEEHGTDRYLDQQALRHETFERFADVPVILIVVQKARMGDTLPASFAAFDLRGGKYAAIPSSLGVGVCNDRPNLYSAFYQDIGRACGYGERPFIASTTSLRDHAVIASNPNNDFNAFNKVGSAVRKIGRKPQEVPSPRKGSSDPEVAADAIFYSYQRGADHMDNNTPVEALERRFILTAEPQCGKTGTYLALIDHFIRNGITVGIGVTTTDLQIMEPPGGPPPPNDGGSGVNPFMDYLYEAYRSTPAENAERIRLNVERWLDFHVNQTFYQSRWTVGEEPQTPVDTVVLELMRGKTIPKKKMATVLDLGCGATASLHTALVAAATAKSRDVHVTSVDLPNREMVPDLPAGANYISADFSNRDEMRAVGLDGHQFDAVVLCQALWAPDPSPLIDSAARCVAEDGVLVIVQNASHFNYSTAELVAGLRGMGCWDNPTAAIQDGDPRLFLAVLTRNEISVDDINGFALPHGFNYGPNQDQD